VYPPDRREEEEGGKGEVEKRRREEGGRRRVREEVRCLSLQGVFTPPPPPPPPPPTSTTTTSSSFLLPSLYQYIITLDISMHPVGPMHISQGREDLPGHVGDVGLFELNGYPQGVGEGTTQHQLHYYAYLEMVGKGRRRRWGGGVKGG